MATVRSLQGVDWLVRTYANTLLTTCQRGTEAGTVRGTVAVDSNPRLSTVVTRLDTLEASCKTDYVADWDASWSAASDRVFADVVAQCPVPLSEMLVDADVNVRRALKTVLRGLELRACQFVAGGGVL